MTLLFKSKDRLIFAAGALAPGLLVIFAGSWTRTDADSRLDFNQLRYDLRKMKSHGLIARSGRRYTYALTEKGTRIALLFVLFHQRLFGPLAHSQFVKRPALEHCPESNLERACRRADAAIDHVVELLHAA